MKLLKKKIIYGCDSRGDGDSPYLTRVTLIETRLGAVYLHKFHRSDSPEHHDHPWWFTSLILWRGYIEETPACILDGLPDETVCSPLCHECGQVVHKRKRVYPGMVLFRRATHRHRVVLVNDKPAYTLVIRGPYVRDWGFFTSKGWQRWKEYFTERGC